MTDIKIQNKHDIANYENYLANAAEHEKHPNKVIVGPVFDEAPIFTATCHTGKKPKEIDCNGVTVIVMPGDYVVTSPDKHKSKFGLAASELEASEQWVVVQ